MKPRLQKLVRFRRTMSSALPLIVLGQVYLLAPALNSSAIGINSTNPTSIPNVFQLSGPLREATRHNSYTYIAGIGAYKFHTQAENWNTARLVCREEGGHLAIINSRAESDSFAKMFANGGPHLDSYNAENAWLGFHDLFGQQGRYETIHGEYLENVGFNEWKDGERENYGSYCGALYKNGKLDYFECDRRLAFFCELPQAQTYIERSDNAAVITAA